MYLGQLRYSTDLGGEKMRLDKLLAHTGFGTRREVKALLKQKRVTVGDAIVKDSSLKVKLDEEIVKVDGEVIHYTAFIYLMLHKPQDYLSATVDLHDKTVIDLVPEQYRHFNVFPVGRLDKDTEGLLLLTNDGKLNHALTSPKKDIFKTYYATIAGVVDEKDIPLFAEGVVLDDGYKTKPAKLKIIKSAAISEIELSISEGKFHQVKRMFEAIDRKVIYLKRLNMGELVLDEQLPLGKIRPLNETELTYVLSLKK